MPKGNTMKLQSAYETEFYVSDAGYLVIKQECLECGHDSKFMLTPDQTRIMFSMAGELMRQQDERWTGIYIEKKED